jgi:F-type H+-transporting ATPase subunit b
VNVFLSGILATEGGAEVAEAPNPIIPAWDEVIWGSLAFLILFVVMAKYAYPSIKASMDGRSAKIQGDLDAADSARAEAEGLRGDYDSKIAEARAEASRIIDEARQQAEVVREERIGAIDGEIAERRAQAAADIEAAKTRALADLNSQVTSLAVGAAEQVVGRSLDEAAYTQLIDDYINQVGAKA